MGGRGRSLDPETAGRPIEKENCYTLLTRAVASWNRQGEYGTEAEKIRLCGKTQSGRQGEMVEITTLALLLG